MYRIGKTDHVVMFSFPLLNDYGLGNQFAEIVHSEFRKDFLVNELHLFCVQMKQAEGVFQISEGGLNAPAHSIEHFNLLQREHFSI